MSMTTPESASVSYYDEETTQKSRWVFLAWGIISIIAGIFLLTQPGMTALVWIQVMAAYLVASGIIDTIGAVLQRQGPWVIIVIASLINFLVGLFVLANPLLGTLVTVQILFFLLVASILVNAVINMWQGIRQPRSLGQIVLGIFQLILGLWLFGHPVLGLLGLVPAMGIYMIAYGIVAVILAFMVNR